MRRVHIAPKPAEIEAPVNDVTDAVSKSSIYEAPTTSTQQQRKDLYNSLLSSEERYVTLLKTVSEVYISELEMDEAMNDDDAMLDSEAISSMFRYVAYTDGVQCNNLAKRKIVALI